MDRAKLKENGIFCAKAFAVCVSPGLADVDPKRELISVLPAAVRKSFWWESGYEGRLGARTLVATFLGDPSAFDQQESWCAPVEDLRLEAAHAEAIVVARVEEA